MPCARDRCGCWGGSGGYGGGNELVEPRGSKNVMSTPRISLSILIVFLCFPAVLGDEGAFYQQHVDAQGVNIKAPRSVSPDALSVAHKTVVNMLAHRPDIAARMKARRAELAIIPSQSFITVLPEFARLSGKKDPNGNPYNSFAVRGAGGIPDQPVTATSEENLLHLENDPFHAEDIARHEFAHAIMNLGFNENELKQWRAIYAAAKSRQLFPGAFAMANADEYWAELSQSYFGVNNEINGRQLVAERDPEATRFLESIYGPLVPQQGD
jgi:hypothetical protein